MFYQLWKLCGWAAAVAEQNVEIFNNLSMYIYKSAAQLVSCVQKFVSLMINDHWYVCFAHCILSPLLVHTAFSGFSLSQFWMISMNINRVALLSFIEWYKNNELENWNPSLHDIQNVITRKYNTFNILLSFV